MVEMMEFEVVYNGTIERERTLSQQLPPPPEPIRPRVAGAGRKVSKRFMSLRARCLEFLQDRPGVYLSASVIAQSLGEDMRRVHTAISTLVKEGRVVRFSESWTQKGPQKYAARM